MLIVKKKYRLDLPQTSAAKCGIKRSAAQKTTVGRWEKLESIIMCAEILTPVGLIIKYLGAYLY